jgi:pyridoxal phosphate enzyme (YggS family)
MEASGREERADIAARVGQLRAQLACAAQRFDRPPLLLAVTKQQPAQRINLLRAVGIDQIGESRVQEWRQKSADLDAAFALHWIGRLQTNKVRYIIDRVCLVHSLDRSALADELGHAAEAAGRRIPALVQVNIAGEQQKAGLPPEDILPFLRHYGGHSGLAIQGLMAIMPLAAEAETLRPYFRQMRSWFEEIQKLHIPGIEMRHLSMGMSADCIVAAQEGATIVRVGSAIFGQRALVLPQDTPR